MMRIVTVKTVRIGSSMATPQSLPGSPNGGFLKSGVPFLGGPYNQDYSVGSMLGYPYFGKLPICPSAEIPER